MAIMLEQAILGILVIGLAGGLYTVFTIKINRLENELRTFKDQQKLARLEQMNKEVSLEGRLGAIENNIHIFNTKVEKFTVVLEDNLETLKSIIARHQDHLEKLENEWQNFWKNYKIERK